jgi:uncharacterized protein (TIGR00730 family)
MTQPIQSVCVFCGSSSGSDPAFAQAARLLGIMIAKSKRTLVYGGGSVGLMGIVADAAMEHGATVIGVIPEGLMGKEVDHRGITELIVTPDMHTRKAKMASISDAFIALPGGFGTLEELFEVLTWRQLDFHLKPCGILNVNGYYDSLIQFIDRMITSGMLKSSHRELIHLDGSIEGLFASMMQPRPDTPSKW